MFCQHCQQETEVGKFCTNCGKELQTSESAATVNTVVEESTSETTKPANTEEVVQQQPSNDFAEQVKKISSNFGDFFLKLVKKPSDAKNVSANDFVSSLVMMGLFSILIALTFYLSIKSNEITMFFEASFVNHFILPLIIYFALFVGVASITFVAIKLTGKNVPYQEILAKYGAYLIPFSLVFVLSLLLSFVGIISLTVITGLISMLGVLVIIPTLIITQYSLTGFDRIYLLIAIYFVSLIIFGLIMRTFLESIIGNILGNLGNLGSFF